VQAPADCDNDLQFVHRQTCSGVIDYQWLEGMENEYELALSAGLVSYFKATGYVGSICGIDDPNYQFGTIETTGAALPADCSGARCSVCDTPTDTVYPTCEPCSDPTQNYVNQESLDDYCKFHTCPSDLADARALIAAQCPASPSLSNDSVMSTGCGLIRVAWDFPLAVNAYYFDAQTQALVGAITGNDTPFGQCYAVTYEGGNVPTADCADAQTCSLCDSPSGAAGSGAGGAGFAGASSQSRPRCPE
jgi:hypothetical protein